MVSVREERGLGLWFVVEGSYSSLESDRSLSHSEILISLFRRNVVDTYWLRWCEEVYILTVIGTGKDGC